MPCAGSGSPGEEAVTLPAHGGESERTVLCACGAERRQGGCGRAAPEGWLLGLGWPCSPMGCPEGVGPTPAPCLVMGAVDGDVASGGPAAVPRAGGELGAGAGTGPLKHRPRPQAAVKRAEASLRPSRSLLPARSLPGPRSPGWGLTAGPAAGAPGQGLGAASARPAGPRPRCWGPPRLGDRC